MRANDVEYRWKHKQVSHRGGTKLKSSLQKAVELNTRTHSVLLSFIPCTTFNFSEWVLYKYSVIKTDLLMQQSNEIFRDKHPYFNFSSGQTFIEFSSQLNYMGSNASARQVNLYCEHALVIEHRHRRELYSWRYKARFRCGLFRIDWWEKFDLRARNVIFDSMCTARSNDESYVRSVDQANRRACACQKARGIIHTRTHKSRAS